MHGLVGPPAEQHDEGHPEERELDAEVDRARARELLGLAALKAGRTEDARKAFEQLLADQRTPPSILERARVAMTSVVSADLVKPAAGTETGAAAGEAPKSGPAAAGPANK